MAVGAKQGGKEMRGLKHHMVNVRAAKLVLVYALLLCSTSVLAQDLVADNMLMFQRTIGGWSKHFEEKAVNYNRVYSPAEIAGILDDAGRNDATIDNGATTKEIRYLVKTYKKSGDRKYLSAAENGIRYLLKAQYENGGWPQFYPDSSSYRSEITFNDNAMVNVMRVLDDVALGKNDMEVVNTAFVAPSARAVEKGIDCMLKTQVVVDGNLTAWCAQYDCRTLKPAKARAFELASLSGMESVGIIEFLMDRKAPSAAVTNAVEKAVAWLEAVKIPGYRYDDVKDAALPEGRDRLLLPDMGGVVWARFYEIGTNEPFFCGRDGVKKKKVSEIEYERRVHYAWYGNWPEKLLKKTYPEWKSGKG